MKQKKLFYGHYFIVFCLFFNLALSKPTQAQPNLNEGVGGTIGVSLSLGSHQNSLGVVFKAYYFYEQVQFNFQTRWRYNVTTYGPPRLLPGMEVQTNYGLLFGWGKQTEVQAHTFLLPFGNQMKRLNALGYVFNVYHDKIKTSQTTGTIAFQANRLWLVTENDALGDMAVDKFRTGGVWIAYRVQNTMIALNTRFWTGNSGRTPVIENSHYPAQYGYRDMSNAMYGRFSHGILTMQVLQALPYGQIIGAEVGLDAEIIRHFLQNKLIHDLYFVPSKWNPSKNPHVPMIDANGLPYTYQLNQRIKPSQGVLHLTLNPCLFY
ncbi:polymorphic toxin type 23 domain-containing protein [uncultured Microscilla sp.]|uniref:polymorphic toxin type 23 domain-containing protein n=1 Tax=uncultured Microscilla sp. TaxID=432653 RepID=UPI002638E0F0|nr:polymorphic toxin type 23 domain-containing protein [uncultured Microscilla sp.]